MERRLAAILAADVVGYSKLMGEDQSGTLAALRQLRHDLMAPLVDTYRGQLVKSMGDGWLLEFPSAADAIDCAIKVQEALVNHPTIMLRIGLHVGDTVFEDEDIFGDGVNVAARLQEVADPGSILISDTAWRTIDHKQSGAFVELGPQVLKNIDKPVTAFAWGIATQLRNTDTETSTISDKPSIAVLPFTNLSSDPEQEYFVDGMVEDIISELSKFNWLLVIARNSSFAYKNQAVDVRQISADLGVRYLLEGSVRRMGRRLRVAVQLVDATSGNQLWTERYDRDDEDLFAIQDEVTATIVGTLAPEITQAEIEKVRRTPPDNLDAWGHYQVGLALFPSGKEEDFHIAIEHFDKAREADPNFVDALAFAAHMRTRLAYFFVPEDRDLLLAEAHEMLQRALRLSPRNCTANYALGRWHSLMGDHDRGITRCRTAIEINPNSALAHFEIVNCFNLAGRWGEVLQEVNIVRRLSPRDTHMSGILTASAVAYFTAGQYEKCIAAAEEALAETNPRFWAIAVILAALLKLGRDSAAAEMKRQLLEKRPDLTMKHIDKMFVAALQPFAATLRQAGLPE